MIIGTKSVTNTYILKGKGKYDDIYTIKKTSFFVSFRHNLCFVYKMNLKSVVRYLDHKRED